MPAGEPIVIGAERLVAARTSEVFALLSDLSRHWPLLGADLINARIVDGSGNESAELLLKGPLPGVSRRVVTRVTHVTPDRAFGGVAEAEPSIARIDWRLDPAAGQATQVIFTVEIEPVGARDRLLLAAARGWLGRRCEAVLDRLEHELVTGRPA